MGMTKIIISCTFKVLTAYSRAELTPWYISSSSKDGTKFATFRTTNKSPGFELNKIAGSTLESEHDIIIVFGA